MITRRLHLASLLLAAAMLLSTAAPVWSDPKAQQSNGNGNGNNGNGNGNNGNGNGNNGNGNGNNGNGNGNGGSNGGSPGNSGNAPGQTKKRKTPTEAVQGDYEIRIVGYYSGSGSATASGSGVTITAKVNDPAGKAMSLQSGSLSVTNDRFTGTGTLDGAQVRIDGRLDPKDGKNNEVLKRGRITFTFSANGHRSRGAGDLK